MALGECAALGVLPRQPDPVTFHEKRAEGERLSSGPVDSLPRLDRFAAGIKESLDRAVNMKALRHCRNFRADIFEHLEIDAGIASSRIVGSIRNLESGPASVQPIGL